MLLPVMTANLAELYASGHWEEIELDYCSRLPEDSRVLEGGSCFGYLPSKVACHVNFWLGIEPDPNLIKLARVNAPGAFFLEGLLSNAPKEYYIRDDFLDSSTNKHAPYGSIISTLNPKCFSLQYLIRKYDINSLVLDIEGDEDILFSTDLSKIEYLLVELHGDALPLYLHLIEQFRKVTLVHCEYTKIAFFER